ncbi:MAG: DUF4253 domain-containing protein [Xanthomonadales bacterium]|jgi:hypothetical protein|nr:DUF4253 domain-containing protein [Xanthomonadales bacterium]
MLTLDALRDRDAGRAIDELLVNATKLAVSGYADLAHRALGLLREDGPWRLPAHGSARDSYQYLLPLVCGLAGRDCPAIGDRPAMSAQEVQDWAAEWASTVMLGHFVYRGRPLGLVGAGWSAEYLASLPSQMGDAREPQRHRVFGRFCDDAEFLLRQRLAAQPSFQSLTEAFRAELCSRGVEPALLDGTAEIAPEAAGIDTVDIVRDIGRYLEVTGFVGGYLQPLFSCAWVLLLEQGRTADAVEVADIWLRQNPTANRCMLDLSGFPAAGDLIRSSGLARINRIVEGMGESWLYYLGTRPSPPPPRPAKPARRKLPAQTRSLRGLRAALKGTSLARLDWIEVPVPESSGEIAWVARLSGDRPIDDWQLARDRLKQTGRWPLLCTSWGAATDAAELSREFFARGPYEHGPVADDVSPPAIVDAAESLDPADFLASLTDSDPVDADARLQRWAHEWKQLNLATDELPSIWAACGHDRLRCEHQLALRERALGVSNPEYGRQSCFTPDHTLLVLLPTAQAADSLAYMHWYGMERGRPECYVRMLQHWSERYGAELYAHYGTMLEFKVSRPPADLDTALELAREHELVAPCTLILPGIALRHYAEGLIDHPVWFLHERP